MTDGLVGRKVCQRYVEHTKKCVCKSPFNLRSKLSKKTPSETGFLLFSIFRKSLSTLLGVSGIVTLILTDDVQ